MTATAMPAAPAAAVFTASKPRPAPQRVCVASDFHLFSSRTAAHERMDEINRAASESDRFILNGDIFDFRWATHPDLESSIDSAIAWLDELVRTHPRVHFVYILGNHDSEPPFVEALAALCRRRANLEWRPLAYVCGSMIFLHGEAATCPSVRDAHTLVAARRRFTKKDFRSRAVRRIYDFAVHMRLHNSVRLIHSKRLSARRIMAFLREVEPHALRHATDIYFGHTHIPFRDYSYRGVRLHNTGSMIRHMRTSIIRLRVAA